MTTDITPLLIFLLSFSVMHRDQNSVMWVVDSQPLRGTSPLPAIALNDATQLYLGGVPPAILQPYGLGQAFGLQGCIRNVRLGGTPIASLEIAAMEAEGVGQCSATST